MVYGNARRHKLNFSISPIETLSSAPVTLHATRTLGRVVVLWWSFSYLCAFFFFLSLLSRLIPWKGGAQKIVKPSGRYRPWLFSDGVDVAGHGGFKTVCGPSGNTARVDASPHGGGILVDAVEKHLLTSSQHDLMEDWVPERSAVGFSGSPKRVCVWGEEQETLSSNAFVDCFRGFVLAQCTVVANHRRRAIRRFCG